MAEENAVGVTTTSQAEPAKAATKIAQGRMMKVKLVEKYKQDEINKRIKVLKGELPPNSVDGGPEQCVYDLANFKADPQIVLPVLLDKLNNSKNEDLRKVIAEVIINISQSEEVLTALRKVANQPMSESIKSKLKTTPYDFYSYIQGVALMSLEKAHDVKSIPLIIEWSEKYNQTNILEVVNQHDKNMNFNNECANEFGKELNGNNIDNKKKMEIIQESILSLGQSPDKYSNFIKAILDDKNASDECVNKLLEIKQYSRFISDKKGEKTLFDNLTPQLKNLKNKFNSEKIDKLLTKE